MENLKKIETIIGLGNTAGLLGSCIYFYKKMTELEKKNQELEEQLTIAVKQLDKEKDTLFDLTSKLDKMSKLTTIQNNNMSKIQKALELQQYQINNMLTNNIYENNNINEHHMIANNYDHNNEIYNNLEQKNNTTRQIDRKVVNIIDNTNMNTKDTPHNQTKKQNYTQNKQLNTDINNNFTNVKYSNNINDNVILKQNNNMNIMSNMSNMNNLNNLNNINKNDNKQQYPKNLIEFENNVIGEDIDKEEDIDCIDDLEEITDGDDVKDMIKLISQRKGTL